MTSCIDNLGGRASGWPVSLAIGAEAGPHTGTCARTNVGVAAVAYLALLATLVAQQQQLRQLRMARAGVATRNGGRVLLLLLVQPLLRSMGAAGGPARARAPGGLADRQPGRSAGSARRLRRLRS